MKRILTTLAALAIAAFALPALSAERMFEASTSPFCDKPQEQRGQVIWENGDGLMRFAGSGTINYEIYGHLIDTSIDAALTGLPAGARAEIKDRKNGVWNGAHGCGNIGSVVVAVTLPKVASANSGVLRVGSERFDVRAVPIAAAAVEWDENNFDNGASMTVAEKQAADAVSLQAAVDRCRQKMLSGGSTNCTINFWLMTTYNQACAQFQAMGASCDFEHSFQLRETGFDFRTTIGNCGDQHGVRAGLTDASPPTLTITLPQNRTGAVFNCLNKPMILKFDRLASGKITDVFPDISVPHSVTQTSNGAPRLTFSEGAIDSFQPQTRLARFTLNQTTLQNLVGIYTYDLDISPSSDSSKARLVLQSQPGFGVRTLAAPVFPASLGRTSSAFPFTVTPIQPTRSNQSFIYEVSGQPPGVQCFTQSTGAITPAANVATFPMSLTVNEVAGCINRQMALTVSAQGAALNDDRFSERITFTIPAKSTVLVPPKKPAPFAPTGTVRINP